MKKNGGGFVLIELLIASLLFALAASGLYSVFLQGIKARQKIQSHLLDEGPLLIFGDRLEKDLRNAVVLMDYPFKGRTNEISFPVLLPDAEASGRNPVFLVEYKITDGRLTRTQKNLAAKTASEKPAERVYLQNLDSFGFEFPYEKKAGNYRFESFWLDDPYLGIPKAVKVHLVLASHKVPFEKWVTLPQGRMGHLLEK